MFDETAPSLIKFPLGGVCELYTYMYTHAFQEVLSHGNRYKMFEMTEERPSYWGPFDNHTDLFSPGERKYHSHCSVQWDPSFKNESVLVGFHF